MTIRELLDEVKRVKEIKTDYALAKLLHVNRSVVFCWYNEKSAPTEYACLQIAEILGKNFDEITALVQIASEKNEARRAVWQSFYNRIKQSKSL